MLMVCSLNSAHDSSTLFSICVFHFNFNIIPTGFDPNETILTSYEQLVKQYVVSISLNRSFRLDEQETMEGSLP